MKRILLISLLPVFLFLGCKDDDKVAPPMKKLESVMWYKNNSPTREGAIEIVYSSQGELSILEEYGAYSSNMVRQYSYIIKNASVSVSRFDYNATENIPNYRTLDINGQVVYKEQYNAINGQNGSRETYTKDRFNYNYKGKLLSSINWTSSLPIGNRYEDIVLSNAVKFDYLNNNLSELTWSADPNNRKKMEIAYSDTPVPTNLPLRFLCPLDLDTWGMLDPLNIYYGTGSKKLPSSIKVIDILTDRVIAEYTFKPYSLFEGYLMNMEIKREQDGVEDVYIYNFRYKN